MAYSSLTLHMLISAPGDIDQGDLRILQQTLNRWNFREGRRFAPVPVTVIPLSWSENAYSEFGIRPQESINRQLVDEADLVIAIFADRLGTPTGEADSGTVEEIERMLAAGKHVSVLRSTAPRSLIGTAAVEEKLRLEKFISRVKSGRGLVFEYREGLELAGQLEAMLSAQAERFLLEVVSPNGDSAEPDDTIGVWPRMELTESIKPDDNGHFRTSHRWYLVLDNKTGRMVRNVTHRFETAAGTPARKFDSRHTDDVIELLPPDGTQRFPLSVSFASAGQAICVVRWEDGGGPHETRATVRTI